MRAIVALSVLFAAGCGGGPRRDAPSDAFVKLDRDGTVPVLAGEFEVASHRIENEKGLVKYSVAVRNLRSGANAARVHVRFFDASFGTEYEKVPVASDESFGASETRTLHGSVDFSGLPDGAQIARLGLSVSLKK
ncbi:MAG: hypothetical protein HYY17_09385 [Planctomycetes bacterium]|nr:hypothetical protein [Planctomycetota bacterium]